MKLIAKNKIECEIDENVWKEYSNLIKGIIIDYDANSLKENAITVNAENCNIKLIDKYIRHYYNCREEKISRVHPPLKDDFTFDDYVSEYDSKFFKFFDNNKIEKLYSFIKDVSYFDINELFQLSCAKLADLCTDISTSEYNSIFKA